MIAYTYNPITMEFVGESSVDESPLEPGVWLMPAYSTEVSPPEFNEATHICYFDKDSSIWKLQDIETEPEVRKVSEEDILGLKEQLKEAIAERSRVLQKLGLTEDEIEVLLVRLPDEQTINNLVGSNYPEVGLPKLTRE